MARRNVTGAIGGGMTGKIGWARDDRTLDYSGSPKAMASNFAVPTATSAHGIPSMEAAVGRARNWPNGSRLQRGRPLLQSSVDGA